MWLNSFKYKVFTLFLNCIIIFDFFYYLVLIPMFLKNLLPLLFNLLYFEIFSALWYFLSKILTLPYVPLFYAIGQRVRDVIIWVKLSFIQKVDAFQWGTRFTQFFTCNYLYCLIAFCWPFLSHSIFSKLISKH